MADSSVSRFGCYTIIWDTTPGFEPRREVAGSGDMARPSKLTPEAVDKFTKAISAGAWPEVAARFAGFSPASYYRFMRGSTPAHAAFRAAVLQAETELEIRLAGSLVQAAYTIPRVALILLEKRFPARWARSVTPDDIGDDTSTRTSTARDEVIVLDPGFVEAIVPKLLAVGARLRDEPLLEAPRTVAFEESAPGEVSTEREAPA